jgi:hypothetical protein
MALKDDAVLKIDSGNYFIAPEGTVRPANLLTPDSPWSALGHTSLENILGSQQEGGESTILGTLQKRTLRTSVAPIVESFVINLQQFDLDSLKLYYGSNMGTQGSNDTLVNTIPTTPTPTRMAWCALYWDGANVFGLYAPSASIIRNENLTLENTDALASLPLRITPTQYDSNNWSLGVLPIQAHTPAGGTGG